MSYFYKFGYSTCEEHSELTMLHDQKFTESEIEDITEEAYVYAYGKYLDNLNADINTDGLSEDEIKWAKTDKEYAREYFKESGVSFDTLWRGEDGDTLHFVEWLKSKGFKEIEIQSSAWVFGWAAVNFKDDWNAYTKKGDLTRRIQKRLSKK